MGIVKQTASIVWEGSIARGRGEINGGSGAIAGVPVTLPSRLGNIEGLTSPEELIAAAHAACFTMTLGSSLARQRTPPERLAVDAVCSLDDTEGQRRIVSIDLEVRGRVPGAEPEAFQRAATEAEQNCVVTKALRGNVEIRAHATLEQASSAEPAA
jgi:osmotically inducible protein OsmC